MRFITILASFALLAAACAPGGGGVPSTGAVPVEDFYRGKTVTLIVGYTPGGGYDQYARLLQQHIGKHIPGNPTVIVENMDGAGSLRAANHLFNAAAKDGTVFGTFGRGLPANELIGQAEAQFKSTEFNWIGSMNEEVSVCVARSNAAVKRFDDVLTTPLRVGATGPDDDTGFFPRILNGLLGTKFDLKLGYPGGNDVNLAIERGEVDGRCGWSWSSVVSTRPQWVRDGYINILTQMSLNKHPDIPSNVPLIMDIAKDQSQKQLLEVVFSRQTMGRPFAAPPGVPKERVDALRKAFMDTMNDPAFKSAAEQAKIELRPKSGDEIQRVVEKIFQTPQDLRTKLKTVLG
jgi:tripartite-type tricarboxylate transporter receptor subunit TctC